MLNPFVASGHPTGMTDQSEAGPKISSATWIGLLIALFGLLVVRQTISYFLPTLTPGVWMLREALNWLCAIILLFIILRCERLPLRSVGIGTTTWWKSILWGLVIAVICFVVGGAIVAVTHFTGGPLGKAFEKLPLWLVTLIVVRAGFVEELFYRGYAIERLQAVGLNRFWAGFIPLLIFGFGHWTGGWANIAIALALGAVFVVFYLWRRDLVANMIAHFLVDFISNVVPRLLAHPH
jgi:membrane protease YdiL (CAAX protease family)